MHIKIKQQQTLIFAFIPQQSRRDIDLVLSIHPFRPSILTFVRPEPYLSTFSFLVQMTSTMDSRYLISFVKINPLTLVIALVLV